MACLILAHAHNHSSFARFSAELLNYVRLSIAPKFKTQMWWVSSMWHRINKCSYRKLKQISVSNFRAAFATGSSRKMLRCQKIKLQINRIAPCFELEKAIFIFFTWQRQIMTRTNSIQLMRTPAAHYITDYKILLTMCHRHTRHMVYLELRRR